jgi:hypothetical protein
MCLQGPPSWPHPTPPLPAHPAPQLLLRAIQKPGASLLLLAGNLVMCTLGGLAWRAYEARLRRSFLEKQA